MQNKDYALLTDLYQLTMAQGYWLYDLAMLSNQPLSVDAMAKFVQRSNQIMMLLAK